MSKIYLDNASTTPLYPEVVDLMTELLRDEYGNPSSIHHHGRKTRAILEDARRTVANELKASIGEIFFTSSATEANNSILKNSVTHLGVKRIISSPTEHHCIIHSLDYIGENCDVEIVYLNVDQYGQPDLDQLKDLLANSSVKTLVSLMYGNNEIGTITDINTVSELCKEHGALFHCDAVQMIGKYAINLDETYFSFLTATAHKFHGPKGIGFFYMNSDNIIPPFIHGGAQERNMRAGTENLYGIAGLAKALSITSERRDEIVKHNTEIRNYFRDQLKAEISDIRFNGNQEENYMSHVLSVSFPPGDKTDLLMFNLDISGISASAGSACSSGIESDSHVLTAIGHPTERKTIRFSFSQFTTKEEIDKVVEVLKNLN